MAQDQEGASDSGKLVSAKEVLANLAPSGSSPSEVSKAERDYLDRFGRQSIRSQASYAHLQGIRDHYWHKSKWSFLLMFAILGMLVFQSVLLWSVGRGYLDFSKYDWLLPALLVQNLGQVIGLAVYAVRYLFSDISSQGPD